MYGRGFKIMLMKARYCFVILGVVLALQHGVVSSSQHLNQITLLLTGTVVTVHESRVGNVKVELVGNGSKKVTETDPYGTFQFEVSPGRYSLSVSAPGFCPFKRPEFEVKPGAALVLSIIPCAAGNVLRYDKEGRYAGEERKYISNFKNDLLAITNSNGPSFDLLIRYAEKRELANATEYEGGEVDYDEADSSSPKGFTTRIVRLGVEINYNLWTIKADSIRYDSRKATLSARGNVVVMHPEQAFKAKSILLDLRNEILLDVVGRSSIARREVLNKSDVSNELRIEKSVLGDERYFDKRVSAMAGL